MKSEICNATIQSTMLGIEDHGIMTAYLMLEGDGWGCGFGGYSLDTPSGKMDGKRMGTAYGIDWIMAVLDTVGVDSWEQLKGKVIRCEVEGVGGMAKRIGHVIKDKWFDPKGL